MLGPVARISNHVTRSVLRTPVRHGSNGGIPGENLPFEIHNRVRLTINFFLFVASGTIPPYLIVLHQLAKK